MSTLLTVSQVLAIAPGTKENPAWINGGFFGVCQRVEKKPFGAGKTMWPCTIVDAETGAGVEVTFFVTPKFKEGDEVRFSGKGMQRTDYNGHAQVKISADKTTVEVRPGAAQVTAAAHSAVAEKANNDMIPGQQVGMAMKAALDLHTSGLSNPDIKQALTAPGFWQEVYTTASDIIRVGRLLESGKLVDPVRVRAAQSQPQQQRSPQPRQPSTVEQELGAEDDPPF